MDPELVTGGGMVNPVNLQIRQRDLSMECIYIAHIYMLITIQITLCSCSLHLIKCIQMF